jgi:GTPase SAR1 family protein
VILVACKKDLRTDPEIIAKLKHEGEKPVTSEVGKQIATQIKADAYMECSAKTREGVQDLFVHAARLSLKKRSLTLSETFYFFLILTTSIILNSICNQKENIAI